LIEAADVSQQAVTPILRAESGIRRFPRNIGKFIPRYMVSGVSVDGCKSAWTCSMHGRSEHCLVRKRKGRAISVDNIKLDLSKHGVKIQTALSFSAARTLPKQCLKINFLSHKNHFVKRRKVNDLVTVTAVHTRKMPCVGRM
jgi:hypothetical protein